MLRQSHRRVGKYALNAYQRYAHAKQSSARGGNCAGCAQSLAA
jgi:hypothetical protein